MLVMMMHSDQRRRIRYFSGGTCYTTDLRAHDSLRTRTASLELDSVQDTTVPFQRRSHVPWRKCTNNFNAHQPVFFVLDGADELDTRLDPRPCSENARGSLYRNCFLIMSFETDARTRNEPRMFMHF